jgi:lipopolysaccharide cholinephosphotransferase
MVKIEGELLRRLQLTELEMLIEVDRICRKYGIRYFLDGGTLLGTIRHGGFIPWDDDADIIMLREEYEKFYDACKKELDTERFFLQDYRTDKHYLWGFAKMRRNGTTFLREGQEHVKCHTGVCIDILYCDNIPDLPLLRRLHYFYCYCIRKGQYSTVGQKVEKSSFMRAWYCLISKIPRDFWFWQLELLAEKTNRKKTKLVRHVTFPLPKRCRYGMPRKLFEESIEKDFEGHSFKIFKRYDAYLKMLYGDYMVLPPPEERQIHPASKVVL